MTSNNCTKDKVFFDMIGKCVGAPFSNIGGTRCIDRDKLTDISAHAIYEYINKNYLDFIFNGRTMKQADCSIKQNICFDSIPYESILLKYKRTSTSEFIVLTVVVTNIRIINC